VLPPLLSVVSLPRIVRLAGRLRMRVGGGIPDDAAAADYVGAVLRRLPPPWRYTCLRRGIVLYHLLRRSGRGVTLHIGVRKDDAGKLAAHAWLMLDGVPYLEPQHDQHRAFAVVATFPEHAVGAGS
jgi:hypothetical protein